MARICGWWELEKYEENHKEMYASVVQFKLVRIFLYLVLCMRMSIAQLNLKTELFKGDLTVDVWVMPPRGIPGIKSRCHNLSIEMYGLKQAHISWKNCVETLLILDL